MANIGSIYSSTWALSLNRGQIVQGVQAINQNIFIILSTTRGTNPLRPSFGSNIALYVDSPITTAVANIKYQIIESLTIWEPRIKIVIVQHKVSVNQLQFFITYTLAQQQQTFQLNITNGVFSSPQLPTDLVVQGIVPTAFTRLMLAFRLDGVLVTPLAPFNGFATVAEMLQFCRQAYGTIGAWFLDANKLFCRVRTGTYTTGSLTITNLLLYTIQCPVPTKTIGGTYQVQFTFNGVVTFSPVFTGSFATVLQWLRANWQQYGNWGVRFDNGDFSDDFSDDFLTTKTVLELNTTTHSTAQINILAT